MAKLNETYKQVDWLAKEGARVVARQPLRRAFFDPRSWLRPIDPDNMTAMDVYHAEEYDEILTVDVPASVVKRWQAYESRLNHIISDADRYGSTPVGYEVEQRKRHERLLVENPMYKEAWTEFQQMRRLLGETSYWP